MRAIRSGWVNGFATRRKRSVQIDACSGRLVRPIQIELELRRVALHSMACRAAAANPSLSAFIDRVAAEASARSASIGTRSCGGGWTRLILRAACGQQVLAGRSGHS